MTLEKQHQQTPLAIIGMACRVPGADGLDSFWNMLIEGRSATADLPPDRLDRSLYYDPRPGVRNKSHTQRGAVLSAMPSDAQPPDLSPRLARAADLTHRVLCQVAAGALRNAGLDPLNLPERNVGVYVGHTIGSDRQGDRKYALAIEDSLDCLRDLEGLAELDRPVRESLCRQLAARAGSQYADCLDKDYDPASHMAAGLISKAFGLSGPFMAVNAACASSLEALLLAARALERGQVEMALVGGSSVCSRDWLVLFSQARSLSADESRPFDERADGLIVGEASVALVVKTLDAALAQGDPIRAVIRGLGVSSDGRGRSLWAPRSEGQTAAIRRAYGPGVDLADVQYLEAHATATQLGDATEIASLSEVFGDLRPARKIPIASVKANIGHTLEAAGLVGIVKTVLCLEHRQIPKAIHLDDLNPKVNWEQVPLYVPRETTPWPATAPGKPRRAAVTRLWNRRVECPRGARCVRCVPGLRRIEKGDRHRAASRVRRQRQSVARSQSPFSTTHRVGRADDCRTQDGRRRGGDHRFGMCLSRRARRGSPLESAHGPAPREARPARRRFSLRLAAASNSAA